jgi:hypothetical protein
VRVEHRRKFRACLLSTCVAGLLVAACAERQEESGADTGSTALLDGRLLVTDDGGSLPDECSLTRVGMAMLALFDAGEAGDLGAIESAFASPRTTTRGTTAIG